MKKRWIIIGMTLAVVLVYTENIQAQSRVVRRVRTERIDGRRILQEDPRRSGRKNNIIINTSPDIIRTPRIVDNDVIEAIERESFDSNRLNMSDMVFKTGGYMTVNQIVHLSNIFDYDSNRTKFLLKAYSNCADRHNFYLTLNTLDFGSSRDKVINHILENKIQNEEYGAPLRKVSGKDMAGIIKTLKDEDFDSRRIKIAKIITCGSLLTSRQIADMAKTMDFDSNRYEFLLYAYDYCSDPLNYVIAVNTLEYSTNRSRLTKSITTRRIP